MLLEPILRARHRANRQDVGDGAALQIDNDRAIGIALLPTPIIDAHDPQGTRAFLARASLFELPQDGIAAGRHCEPPQQPFTDPSPCRVPEETNDLTEAGGASSERIDQGGQSLDKGPIGAGIVATAPARKAHFDNRGNALDWKVL